MAIKTPKLRGSSPTDIFPWPIGEIPDQVIYLIGRELVHKLAIGHVDITGNDFGAAFAKGAGGTHRNSPLGIADVIANGCVWSVKTIKAKKPIEAKRVRLISGRNSPDYSLKISDPRKDPEVTGKAVLAIWNQRVNEVRSEYDELRIVVLIRNIDSKEFVIFEVPADKFPAGEYRWTFNKRGNLEGHNKVTDEHCFTWQPHGSQFTVIRQVPGSARCFSINRAVPLIKQKHVLDLIQFSQDWIKIERG